VRDGEVFSVACSVLEPAASAVLESLYFFMQNVDGMHDIVTRPLHMESLIPLAPPLN
jgi:phytoene/squalene synthetase